MNNNYLNSLLLKINHMAIKPQQDTTSTYQPHLFNPSTGSWWYYHYKISPDANKDTVYIPQKKYIENPDFNPVTLQFYYPSADTGWIANNPMSELVLDAQKVKSLNYPSYSAHQIKEMQAKKQHTPQAEEQKPLFSTNDWITGIIILSFFLLAIIRLLFKRQLSEILRAMYDIEAAAKYNDNKNVLNKRCTNFMSVIFLLNLSLFLFQTADYYRIDYHGLAPFNVFLIILGSVSLTYGLKVLVIKIMGLLLNAVPLAEEYQQTIGLYNKALGLFLFPLIILIPFIKVGLYTTSFIEIGISFSVLFFLFRLIRGMRIFIREKVPFFYLILYLCGLEIIPLLVIIKAVYLFAVK